MKGKIISHTPLSVPTNFAAESSLKLIVSAWSDYKKIAEVESTRREEISAWKEVTLFSLQAQRDTLRQYLEHTFSERALMIRETFNVLDKGIEGNNYELVNKALDTIVTIAKTSPLEGAKAVMTDMYDPKVKSIEI